ncbi:MAG: type II and III secretion system protein [bacterium]|nr:type II and III secretion system protein [bacterium]
MRKKQVLFFLISLALSAKIFAAAMVEVSVDIIEIKQTNQDIHGVTWNESINFEEGLGNSAYFNFANATADDGQARGTASNFSIGSFERFSPLAAALRLMITNNKARILANPKLATEAGSQASFVVGGEIPVPVVSPQGTSIEWKTYGINLQIRPNVIAKKKVSAMIQISVSDLDYANSVKLEGYDVPGLLNRSANSKVTVKDGGTVVIAGLKQARKEKTSQRVPFISKIPVIGWFFQGSSQTDSDTSMVVFVTFKIINDK